MSLSHSIPTYCRQYIHMYLVSIVKYIRTTQTLGTENDMQTVIVTILIAIRI